MIASVPQVQQTVQVQAPIESLHPSFGMVVGKAGDVNGDGVPDLLVGDSAQPDRGNPATVWILSGKDGTALRFVRSPLQECSAFQVDGGVDLDGDHVPDFLIAARPYLQATHSRIDLVSGKTGSILRSIPTGGCAWGNGSWARFLGDVDHDATQDVAFLVLDETKASGSVTIVSGRNGDRITELPIESHCNSMLGGLMPTGSLDSEGPPELAVVVGGGTCPARLSVYSITTKKKLWDCTSSSASDRCYAALAMLGDLDHDGVREIAVSFVDHVDVVLGRTGDRLFALDPREKTDSELGLGRGIATLGDIDRDGIVDFAVSETEAGLSNGQVVARSGVDGHVLWDGNGEFYEELWHFGYPLVAVGDLDGDGITDLVAGTCGNMSGSAGLVRVLSGKTGAILFQFARYGDDVVVTRSTRAPERKK